MENSNPIPIISIQQSRFTRQDGWRLDDISLCSSGNIAVAGHMGYRSYVCIYSSTVDSRDKPTLLYQKQFEDEDRWEPRYISFMEPNSTEIVTCKDDIVQVIDYNRDVVLRSRKVNGKTRCLSVSESQIFIGLYESDIVNIYDKDLNRINSIRLKGIRRDYPWDIAAAADRLYVCTWFTDRAIVYSQNSGSILAEYTTGQYNSNAYSITVSVKLDVVAVLWKVLWNERQVAVYSFTNNNCLVVFDVESGVSGIRISDQGRIVTGNEGTGEVKTYDLAQLFTFDNLKVTLGSLLSENDQEKLLEYFSISEDSLKDGNDGKGNGKEKSAKLLKVLEEKGLLHHTHFHQLKKAFLHLGSCHASMVMSHVDFYEDHAGRSSLPSCTQPSTDDNSCHKLHIDGITDDWSVVDMSLGPGPFGKVVLSGYHEGSGKTSIDCVHENDSPWVMTREFDVGRSKSQRFVSFMDENQIVSCCHNTVEVINLKTNESKCNVELPLNNSASCVTMSNSNIYIGLEESVDILVLNIDLQVKMTIKLQKVENIWPTDLAACTGRLLVCLKNNSSSQVAIFREDDGQRAVEYRIDMDKAEDPQSVAVHEESDLVAILWDVTKEEYYEVSWHACEKIARSYLSLHSLSQGYCLSIVSVGLSIHGNNFHCGCYTDGGCSSGKRVRICSKYVAVLDTMSGIHFFDVNKLFTSESVKTALCQMISSRNSQELKCSRKDSEGAGDVDRQEDSVSDSDHDDYDEQNNSQSEMKNAEADDDDDECTEDSNSSESDSEDDDDEDICLSPKGIHVVDIILAILVDKKHLESEDVSTLKEEIRHKISRQYVQRVEQVESERNLSPFLRFECMYICDQYICDVSFGPCDKVAAFGSDDCGERMPYLYVWDGNNQAQPTMTHYRQFTTESMSPELLFSFLDENRVVTCHDDIIEISDFSLNREISKSIELTKYGSRVSCMDTKDGQIFTGFNKSSQIVVFDSKLMEKMTIDLEVKDGEWPDDLTVVAGRLIVCTGGRSSRALSFSEKDGRKMMEYKYIGQGDAEPLSITVQEYNDLVGISWVDSNYEDVVTLHSLSKGHSLALLDHCDSPVRLSFKNGLTRIHKRDGEFYLLDQALMFKGWKTLIASLVKSSGDYEKLQEFFQISNDEVITKAETLVDTRRNTQWNIKRMMGLMAVLEERGDISHQIVHVLKSATSTLVDGHVKKLCQPLDAFVKFTVDSDNHAALSLLDLQNSTVTREDLNTNTSLVSTGSSSSQVQILSLHSLGPSLPTSSKTTNRVYEKRLLTGPDQSNSGTEISEKRARTDATISCGNLPTVVTCVLRDLTESPRQSQIDPLLNEASFSYVQLMEEDPAPNPTSEPFRSLVPMTGPQLGMASVEVLPSSGEIRLSLMTTSSSVVTESASVMTGLSSRVVRPPSIRSVMGIESSSALAGPLQEKDPSTVSTVSPSLTAGPFTEVIGPSNFRMGPSSLMVGSSSLLVGTSVRSDSLSVVHDAARPRSLKSLGGTGTSSLTARPSPVGARQPLHANNAPTSYSGSTMFQSDLTLVPASTQNFVQSIPPANEMPITGGSTVQQAGSETMHPFGEGTVLPPMNQNGQITLTQLLNPSKSARCLTRSSEETREVISQAHQSLRQVSHSNVTVAPPCFSYSMSPQVMQPIMHSHISQGRQNAQIRTAHRGGPNTDQHTQQVQYFPSQQGTQQGGQSLGTAVRQLAVENMQDAHHNRNIAVLQNAPQTRQPVAHQTRQPFEHSVPSQEEQGIEGASSMQRNVQEVAHLGERRNTFQEEGLGTSLGTRQLEHMMLDPARTASMNKTQRKESDSDAKENQGRSEPVKAAAESCVQKVVTPLLKEINDKLELLLGSGNRQNIPGTSSQSGNVSNPAVLNPPEIEPDEEGRRAWESLSEYNRMSLQAFRDMTDDRAELVRRLVEMVFTEEERHSQNCFGKSGKQKLDENKLRRIRKITFYLCPIVTKKTDNDKLSLEDVEWKRLCEVIDKANRHYREKIKRQENRR